MKNSSENLPSPLERMRAQRSSLFDRLQKARADEAQGKLMDADAIKNLEEGLDQLDEAIMKLESKES